MDSGVPVFLNPIVMKINRRGFVAAAVLLTHQAIGKTSLFSSYSQSNQAISKLKEIFKLKKHFFQKELKVVFREKMDSFQKLGYKSSFDGCLMNDNKTYAIYPIELQASGKTVEQSFLLFSKNSDWSYVGVWNNFEMDSFLSFVEKSKFDAQLVSELLPTERMIDGVSNPYLNSKYSYSFMTQVKENVVSCRIKHGTVKFEDFQEFEKTFKI